MKSENFKRKKVYRFCSKKNSKQFLSLEFCQVTHMQDIKLLLANYDRYTQKKKYIQNF